MEYKIVTGSNIGSLETAVNNEIARGWRPIGGVGAWSGGMMVFQAMIKER